MELFDIVSCVNLSDKLFTLILLKNLKTCHILGQSKKCKVFFVTFNTILYLYQLKNSNILSQKEFCRFVLK